MSEVLSKQSELYYSDEVNEEVALDVGSSTTPQQTLKSLSEFSQSITTKLDELEANGVMNVFARIRYDDDFVYEHPAVICHLSGSKPWSEEKIAAFTQQVSEKKQEANEDVEMLKALIEKHQDVALETLLELLKSK